MTCPYFSTSLFNSSWYLLLLLLGFSQALTASSFPASIQNEKDWAELPLQLERNSSMYSLEVLVGRSQQLKLVIHSVLQRVYLFDIATCPLSLRNNCVSTSSPDFTKCKECGSDNDQVNCPLYFSQLSVVPEYWSFSHGLCIEPLTEEFDDTDIDQLTDADVLRFANGYIGLGHVTGQIGNPFWSLLPVGWKPIYALNFSYTEESTLRIGGYEDVSSLVWSESDLSPSGHHDKFPLYSLTFCGVSFYGVRQNSVARINTGIACLHLPETLISALEGWFDMECSEHSCRLKESEVQNREFNERTNMETIKVVDENIEAKLPVFSFQLSLNSSALLLPLRDLLLRDSKGRLTRELCIRRGSPNLIEFGTVALRPFYTVVNHVNGRIGLANKFNTTQLAGDDRGRCKERVSCQSPMRANELTNRCEPPPCQLYLFQDFNTHTNTCTLKIGMNVVFVLLLVILAIGEYVLFELYSRASRGVLLAVPNQAQV